MDVLCKILEKKYVVDYSSWIIHKACKTFFYDKWDVNDDINHQCKVSFVYVIFLEVFYVLSICRSFRFVSKPGFKSTLPYIVYISVMSPLVDFVCMLRI